MWEILDFFHAKPIDKIFCTLWKIYVSVTMKIYGLYRVASLYYLICEFRNILILSYSYSIPSMPDIVNGYLMIIVYIYVFHGRCIFTAVRNMLLS